MTVDVRECDDGTWVARKSACMEKDCDWAVGCGADSGFAVADLFAKIRKAGMYLVDDETIQVEEV